MTIVDKAMINGIYLLNHYKKLNKFKFCTLENVACTASSALISNVNWLIASAKSTSSTSESVCCNTNLALDASVSAESREFWRVPTDEAGQKEWGVGDITELKAKILCNFKWWN